MHGPQPGAGVHEDLPDAALLCLILHPLAGSAQIELHGRGDLLAAKDFGRGFQVFQARVHTGEQVGLLDRDFLVLHFGEGLHDLHCVWSRYMRRHLGEIEDDLRGIDGVGIGARRILDPVREVGLGEALDPLRFQALVDASQVLDRDLVHREPTDQRAPLSRHVGDGETGIHGKRCDARAAELNGGVEDFIVVVEAAEGDDDVLAGCTFGELAFEADVDRTRDLPPEFAGSPHGGSVGADDGRAYGTERAIHIRVRVRGNHERTGDDIAALDHDLVADAGAGGMEVDPMLAGEGFDGAVFLQVGLVPVLDVMVEGENKLTGIANLLCANALELAHNG